MIKILNLIVSKIKGESYKLDEKVKTANLMIILIDRFMNLLRGIFRKIGIHRCGKILFIGKRVILKHKNFMKFGTGVTIGDYVEIDALSREGLQFGDNVKIGNYSIIRCSGSLKELGKGIKIGDNFGCGDFCFFGAAGGIQIGNDVIMGQNIRFHSENHYFDRTDILIRHQGVFQKGIIIEDDCWVGAGTVFLDGVKVGKGSVIGANTLVNKDIPPYSVAVGSPVRIIKNRLKYEE